MFAVSTYYPTDGGFPARLRSLREAKGEPQADAAIACGVRPQTWYMYESGRLKPRLDTLDKIAKHLDTTPLFLLFGDKPPETKAPAYPALDDFLRSPEGVGVADGELSFLRSYHGPAEPSVLTYHYLLLALRSGKLSPENQNAAENSKKQGARHRARRGK